MTWSRELRNRVWNFQVALGSETVRAVFWLLNLWPLPCRKEFNCGWVYPYGFVPEAGCPWHD